jgi:exosortase
MIILWGFEIASLQEQNKSVLQNTGEDTLAAAESSALNNSDRAATNRWFLFAGWCALFSVVFALPLLTFVRTSLSNDDSSYLVVIPFISLWIMFIERRNLVFDFSYDGVLCLTLILLACGPALASLLAGDASTLDLQLSGYVLSLILFWTAGFALLFGKSALKAFYFPFLFLFLMVPLPKFLLEYVIHLLQAGSAWITGILFDVLGVPVLREGFIFHLARVNIEVAKECSGIRSSMALLILALLVAHFRLRSFWKKTLFLTCGLLMMVLKNGIRIVSLTLLAIHVDPSFLYGRLHHQGGFVFFLISLLLLAPLLWLLQRGEPALASEIHDLSAQPTGKLPTN